MADKPEEQRYQNQHQKHYGQSSFKLCYAGLPNTKLLIYSGKLSDSNNLIMAGPPSDSVLRAEKAKGGRRQGRQGRKKAGRKQVVCWSDVKTGIDAAVRRPAGNSSTERKLDIIPKYTQKLIKLTILNTKSNLPALLFFIFRQFSFDVGAFLTAAVSRRICHSLTCLSV